MDENIKFYNENSKNLGEMYNSVNPEKLHGIFKHHLPAGGSALDIGSGTGRDAKWLSEKGFVVTAVEPSEGLRKIGEQYTKEDNVEWVDDKLPRLSNTLDMNKKFDFILASAVWMHIEPKDRKEALRNITSLLKPNGRLVITLRHGQSNDERSMYPVSVEEITSFSDEFNFSKSEVISQLSDELNRGGVSWEYLVLKNNQKPNKKLKI